MGTSREDFLRAAGTSLLSLPLLGFARERRSVEPGRGDQAAGTPANIVAICTDDQTAASVWAMPTVMTQLAAKGVRVLPAFAATPICGPARGALLSGRWSHNTGVTNTKGAYPRMKETGMEADTFATRLKAAGYATGFFGKYNNSYDERRVPPGWDRWFAFREPFNEPDWYEFNSDGRSRRFDRATHNETDVIASRVTGFVRSRGDARSPWLAYVCPHDPHGPYFPADRHADEFAGATWDPASEGEKDLSDKPALVRSEPTYTQAEEAQNEREYRGKLRELQAVDDLVGGIISALEETGQLGNTYIFFFTDNGYLFGEHRLQKKNLPYDEACRMPFVARGPGVVSGFESNALVSQLDVAPTLCAIGGASTGGMDGRSLLPILGGEEPEGWRRCLMIEDVEKGWYSLRTPTHWYTEWDSGERELYDLLADPGQTESIHDSDDPATRTMMAELSATLDRLKRCSGQTCRGAEEELRTAVT